MPRKWPDLSLNDVEAFEAAFDSLQSDLLDAQKSLSKIDPAYKNLYRDVTKLISKYDIHPDFKRMWLEKPDTLEDFNEKMLKAKKKK